MINFKFIRETGFIKWFFRTIGWQFSKRVLKRNTKVLLLNKETIVLPYNNNFASEVFVSNGNVDWGTEEFFRNNFHPGGILLDIGAHIGYYSLLLCDKAEKVYAFEPDPRNVPLLETNIRDHNNIMLIQKAASSKSGRFEFYLGRSGATSSLNPTGHSNKATGVEVITVDQFREEKKLVIHGIKTDVEGHDLEVLKGARQTMLEDKPIVATEEGYSPALQEYLDSVGYLVFGFMRQSGNRRVSFKQLPAAPEFESKMLLLIHKEDERTKSWLSKCN